MENPFDEDISAFAVVFTRAIIAWNNVERSAQHILEGLSKGGIGVTAAIAHLKPVPLADTLLTVADALNQTGRADDGLAAKHVTHFVEGMEILRAYRNHFVHNLLSVGKSPYEPVFQGRLHVTEARKKLSVVQGQLTTERLSLFMQHTLRLNGYGEQLTRYFARKTALSQLFAPLQPLESLERPIWPPKLKKNRSYPLEGLPPLGPSSE